jgi:hypothetical protein
LEFAYKTVHGNWVHRTLIEKLKLLEYKQDEEIQQDEISHHHKNHKIQGCPLFTKKERVYLFGLRRYSKKF